MQTTPNLDAYFLAATRAARAAAAEGYAVRAYRDGGESFSCILTRHGADVATVANDGRGGCHRYGWQSREARVDAEATAARLLPGVSEALDTIIAAMLDTR